MKVKFPTTLKDALYNLAPAAGSDPEYCKGVVVGAASAMMACGMKYSEAIGHIKSALPEVYRTDCIPDAFKSDLG